MNLIFVDVIKVLWENTITMQYNLNVMENEIKKYSLKFI